ncbi:MAG TPA: hypothetical protein EYQ56_01270 [Methylophilaceae bacterium]|nr:hypothetical protein [Methylophilaceae bacterium]
MGMMNQEDVLRELELLPVWQLRLPATKAPIETTAAVAPAEVNTPEEVAAEPNLEMVEQEAKPAVMSEQLVSEVGAPPYAFRCIVSEDAQWLFVLQQQQSEEADSLLQNMMKAVSVKVGQNIEQADVAAVSQFASKVIVVMGEEAAQQLLTVTQSLAELRGQPHLLNDIPVVTTYSPEALLDNLADKSKAWEDLCLARFTITNLQKGTF